MSELSDFSQDLDDGPSVLDVYCREVFEAFLGVNWPMDRLGVDGDLGGDES